MHLMIDSPQTAACMEKPKICTPFSGDGRRTELFHCILIDMERKSSGKYEFISLFQKPKCTDRF